MSRFTTLSRLSIACSLVASLASPVFARAVMAPDRPVSSHVNEPHFARAPLDQTRMDLPVGEPDIVLDRATVRAALAKARAANLARFRAYQKAGVFPSNTFQDRKLNVWLDEAGHFCAAATIIRASGQTALVDRVAAQNNFIRLADVKQGPLMDWILTSGLTQQEIAAIQEPFMPVQVEPHVVDPQLRQAEDARLRARYRTVDRMIVKQQKRSLELATDRLMQHPELAWRVVHGV